MVLDLDAAGLLGWEGMNALRRDYIKCSHQQNIRNYLSF
jgi:hypothetical protein